MCLFKDDEHETENEVIITHVFRATWKWEKVIIIHMLEEPMGWF